MPADSWDEALWYWRSAPRLPASAETVVRLLETRFSAYEIPLSAMSRLDWRNDQEVREPLVDRLFTITDARVLRALGSEDQERPSDEEAEEYWRQLFEVDAEDPHDSVGYRLLLTQMALGERILIVLEREGDHITGFKVSGLSSAAVHDALLSLIGYPERRPNEAADLPRMIRGDVSDDGFRQYLAALLRHRDD